MRILVLLFALISFSLYSQTEPLIHPSQIGNYGGGSNAFMLSNGSTGAWNSATSLRGLYLLPTATVNGSTLRYNTTGTIWESNTIIQNDGTQVGIGMAPVSGDILSILGKTRFYSPIKLASGSEGSNGQIFMSTGSTTIPAWTTAAGDVSGAYNALQISSGVIVPGDFSISGASTGSIFKYNGSDWALSTDAGGEYYEQSTTPSAPIIAAIWRNTSSGNLSVYNGSTFKPQTVGYLEGTTIPPASTGAKEGSTYYRTDTQKSWILSKYGDDTDATTVDALNGGTSNNTRPLDVTWSTNQVEQTFTVPTSGYYEDITLTLQSSTTSNTLTVTVVISNGSTDLTSGTLVLSGFAATNTNEDKVIVLNPVYLTASTTYYIRPYMSGSSPVTRWSRQTTGNFYANGTARYGGADQANQDHLFKIWAATAIALWFPTENLLNAAGTVTSIATTDGITGGTITSTGTIGLTGQALSLHNMTQTGFIARTGSNAYSGRTITASGSGISITDGDGIAGNPTISNTGDTDASNDITNSTSAGGALTGTYPNPTLGINAITSASQITDGVVSSADLRNSAALSVIGNGTNASAVPTDIVGTDGQVLRVSGTTLGFGTVATAGITDDAVTFDKIQNSTAASKLIGRGSAFGAGNFEEITLGSGLTMTGTTLSATGGGGGDNIFTADLTQTAARIHTLLDNVPDPLRFESTGASGAIMYMGTEDGIEYLGSEVGIYSPVYYSNVATSLSTEKASFYVLSTSGTQTLTTSPLIGAAYKFIKNASGGTVTIDPSGAATINGASTYSLPNGDFIIIAYNYLSTDWVVYSISNILSGSKTQTVTSNHTLIDNSSTPLSFTSPGGAGNILNFVTTDNQERIQAVGREGIEAYSLTLPTSSLITSSTITTSGSSRVPTFIRLGAIQTYTLNTPTLDGQVFLIANQSGGTVVIDPQSTTTIGGASTLSLAANESVVVAYSSAATDWAVFDTKGSGGSSTNVVNAGSVTTSQNDWNPSGFNANTVEIQLQPSETLIMITGLVPTSSSTNQKVIIRNTGTNICFFDHQNTSSSANNRFIIAEKGYVLFPKEAIDITYVAADNRWYFPLDSKTDNLSGNAEYSARKSLITRTHTDTRIASTVTTGGMAGTSFTAGNTRIMGAVSASTGTTSNATGRSATYFNEGVYMNNTVNSVNIFRGNFLIENLSDATTSYLLGIGYFDAVAGINNGTNNVGTIKGFMFAHGYTGQTFSIINGTNLNFTDTDWHVLTMNTSDGTLTDTNVAPTVGTPGDMDLLEIVKIPGMVKFYINNTLVHTATTSIAYADTVFPGYTIGKTTTTATTTARRVFNRFLSAITAYNN